MTTATQIPPVVAPAAPAATRAVRPIPMTRLAKVELRKMFDTRAGFWLMASVGIVSVLATAATILWAPDSAIDQETFASALGMLIGFMLGVLMRSSAAAVVGYFVYSLVLPGALAALASFQEWFRDL